MVLIMPPCTPLVNQSGKYEVDYLNKVKRFKPDTV